MRILFRHLLGRTIEFRLWKHILFSWLLLFVSLATFSQGLTFSQSTFSFEANVDGFDFAYFDIINSTDSTIKVTDVTITGPNANEFSFSGGNFGDPPYSLGDEEPFGSRVMASLEFMPTVERIHQRWKTF